ncbi:MAG: sigma-70 family RNA polymerase sigma factor [Acidobacteriota bacterium]
MTTAEPGIEDLYRQWEPTIRSHARRHAPFARNGLTAEDLAQAAALAFVAAFERWNRDHPGHKAWMRRVINTAITDALRSQQTAVRLPRQVWTLRVDAATTESELTQKLRRTPSTVELAEALNEHPDNIIEMQSKTAPPKSLDERRPDSGDLALELADAGSWEMEDKITVRLERQRHVAKILSTLPTPNAKVIRLKWGLDANGYELDNKDIAKKLGRSTEWVRLRLRQAEHHIHLVGLDRSRRRDLRLTAEDIEALLLTSDLAFYDLRHADIARADLTRADLTGADLTEANLTKVKLIRANLSRANIAEARLTGADLSGADLTGANIAKAKLVGANLHRARFHGAKLTGAKFEGAKLAGAHLDGADLAQADLAGVDLEGVVLEGAKLVGVALARARLAWANLMCANLDRANLKSANLTWAKLARASLMDAELVGACLAGTNLAEADLTGANLTGAYLVGANLAGAKLIGANLTWADLTQADLTGADLTGANLLPSQLGRERYRHRP